RVPGDIPDPGPESPRDPPSRRVAVLVARRGLPPGPARPTLPPAPPGTGSGCPQPSFADPPRRVDNPRVLDRPRRRAAGTPGDLSGSVASLRLGGAVAGGGGEAPGLLPRLGEGSAGARPCPPPAPAGEARAGVAGGACRAPTSRCFGGRSTPAADPVHSERSG